MLELTINNLLEIIAIKYFNLDNKMSKINIPSLFLYTQNHKSNFIFLSF